MKEVELLKQEIWDNRHNLFRCNNTMKLITKI